MRILVCGGRDYGKNHDDLYKMNMVLLRYKSIMSLIIHGAARGADILAGKWAKVYEIPVLEFPADWNKYGKRAGFLRNKQMLDEGKPDMVIAFPGGKGTANMIMQAKSYGIEVIEIK